VLQNLVHLFYPQLCAACRQPLATGSKVVCVHCRLQLPYLDHFSLGENIITKMFWGRAPVQTAFSLLYFKKDTIVQELLHALKYRNRKDVAEAFGQEIGQKWLSLQNQPDFDLVVPVPMHRSKYKTRGYNQAELIAAAIAEVMHKPLATDLLKKPTRSESQTKKGRLDRWNSAEQQFVHSGKPHAPGILLVDDVITTGATIEACIQTLQHFNSHCRVSVATLAYAYR
jgi:ComF family protein